MNKYYFLPFISLFMRPYLLGYKVYLKWNLFFYLFPFFDDFEVRNDALWNSYICLSFFYHPLGTLRGGERFQLPRINKFDQNPINLHQTQTKVQISRLFLLNPPIRIDFKHTKRKTFPKKQQPESYTNPIPKTTLIRSRYLKITKYLHYIHNFISHFFPIFLLFFCKMCWKMLNVTNLQKGNISSE